MSRKSQREPIAIVGIGCRFPGGAKDPESFWKLLIDGVDAITEIPRDRWNIEEFYHPVPGVPGKSYSKWGGFIESIDRFEPECFGISPREAAHMDPQQRLLLEVAWEALEDGGQVIDRLAGTKTGVFVGISTFDYLQIQGNIQDIGSIDPHSATGAAFSIAANRISYCLNLSGPSLAVDTACSSALVATDLACRSIWSRDCDLALAGGVNVIASPIAFISFCAASMLSPDGRCHAFDASANGFVRGEGAGIVVLKPLAKALEDGDPVYAVIVGSGANQDGRTSGIAAPSQGAQESLLREVCRQAGVRPSKLSYVEAHGTGTAIGDPIEAIGIGRTLSAGRRKGRECVIGSVKTNIGHLEAAAGVAGLIKAALVLKHRMIPPNLHFHAPNPKIPFQELKLRVPTSLEPLPETSGPAFVGVNSFGFGGTNAHVLLRERPAVSRVATPRGASEPARPRLFPLSARTPDGLKDLARSYQNFIAAGAAAGRPLIAEICYNASLRRSHFDRRVALVARDLDELRAQLAAFLAEGRGPGISSGSRTHGQIPKVAFVFSGQGPQWWGMGRELMQAEPVFRQAVESCDRLLKKHADWSLLNELSADEASSRLQETSIAQPALFALQAGLAALWNSWGIVPGAVTGHSVGEIAAAYVAGALTLEQAVRVVFHRGRCMDFTGARGKMLAVAVAPKEAAEEIRDYEGAVAIGAVNSPESVTLSGDPAALEELAQRLDRKGIFARFLQVGYAFHSAQMDPLKDELLNSLSGLQPHSPALKIFSTVTGASVEGPQFDEHYWWDNVRRCVRFAEAMDGLIADGYDTFVELSPHPVLAGSISECLRHRGHKGIVVPSLRRGEDEQTLMLGAFGSLYSAGYPVDWRRLWPRRENSVRLPGYAWQRSSYWHESEYARRLRLGKQSHPLLGRALESVEPSWELALDRRVLSYLSDHRLLGHIVVPATAYVEIALGVAREVQGPGSCILENLQIQRAITLSEADDPPRVQTRYNPADTSVAVHCKASNSDQSWTLNAACQIGASGQLPPAEAIDLQSLRRQLPQEVASETWYELIGKSGLNFGPSFQGVNRIWRKDGEALGRIELPEHLEGEAGNYIFHPALLDACFQVGMAAVPLSAVKSGVMKGVYIPVWIDRVRFYGKPEKRVWSRHSVRHVSSKVVEGDFRIYDEEGRLLIEIAGYRLQSVGTGRSDDPNDIDNWFYDVQWERRPLPGREGSTPGTDSIPSPRHIADYAVDDASKPADGSSELPSRLEAEKVLEELSVGYILQALGAFGNQGDRITRESLIDRLNPAPRFSRLMRRFLHVLEQAGYLRRVGAEQWEIARVPAEIDPQELWRSAVLRFPALLAELTLVGRCGTRLREALRGEVDPLELLFPDGSTLALDHLYQDSSSFRPYNAAIQGAIRFAVSQMDDRVNLRILEVGAGTGGTTAHLLPELPPGRTEYVFSDVSNVFLLKAEQKFRGYPFVKFEVLDLEKDPLEQGFEPHSFNIILASDVLHATRSVRDSLRHIAKLLSSRGLLLLMEVESASAWVDIVFGLTEGWWRFADFETRKDYPLLERETWKSLLEEVGCADIEILPRSAREGGRGQAIFLARGPHVDQNGAKRDEEAKPRPNGTEKGTWLIFADRSGVGGALASLLESTGEICIPVAPGGSFQNGNGNGYLISPESPQDMELLVAAVSGGKLPPLRGVVHLWSLDTASPDDTTPASLRAAEILGCYSVMHLIQAWYKLGDTARSPRIIAVTRGAQPAGAASDPVAIGQSPLLGLSRVVGNEHPDLVYKMVDLDPARPAGEVDSLWAELWTEDREEEIALRGGSRLAPRLKRVTPQKIAAEIAPNRRKRPFRLEAAPSGVMEDLGFREIVRPAPGKGQVTIEVLAASLNFRDVLKALGLYPTDAPDYLLLGDECAGRIIEVGPAVENFQVGDEVVAVAPGSFASYVAAPQALIWRKPAHMSFEEAVTMPVVFLTAYYALRHLARLQPGESVLIHSAAGGVGLAALQIARNIGAEIFATAGSPEKRDLLRMMGVRHVMDSRSLAFADQVMELTGGRGVDAVLNSLAGQAIAKGLSCLAPYGRFLELGKRDIYQNSKVGLWPFRKNIAFFAIDLGGFMLPKHEFLKSMLTKISNRFHDKSYRPLPHRVFPAARVVEAFRHMAQARHVGKIVLSMKEDGLRIKPRENEPTTFRPDATYLITGGFGGLGLVVAKWIVENGGRSLALAGRSGARSEEAKRAVAELRSIGAQVMEAHADVTDEKQVADLLAKIDQGMPPLKGVFHAAMALDDGIVLQLNTERFRKVMAPKLEGAWNLHAQTLTKALDFFVLFSSVSSLVGSRGQANYTAANTFLDTLAFYRRAHGLPAISINWGVLAEAGYVARHRELAEMFKRMGLLGVSSVEAMAALDVILRRKPTQSGVIRVEWQRLARSFGKIKTAQRLSAFVTQDGSAQAGEGEASAIREELLAAPPGEKEGMLQAYVREQVATVLRASAAKIDFDQPLNEMGLDSLMAIELKNRVEADLALSLPVAKLIQNPTIRGFSRIVFAQLGFAEAAAPESAAAPVAKAAAEAASPDLSLVPLRPQGSRSPLFCLHPADGLVNIYRDLAERLEKGMPVYGLQSIMTNGHRDGAQSMDQKVKDYVRRIKSQQGAGPYHLLGFSFGGFLAMAIARALEVQGQAVAFVGLVDCDPSWTDASAPRDHLLRNLILELSGFIQTQFDFSLPLNNEQAAGELGELTKSILSAPEGRRSGFFIEWLKAGNHLPEDISLDIAERYLSGFEANLQSMLSLKLAPILAPLYVWWAGESRLTIMMPERSWKPYTEGAVVEEVIDGNHYGLMCPPAVEALAAQLNRHLGVIHASQSAR